jgi:hypothetical protein
MLGSLLSIGGALIGGLAGKGKTEAASAPQGGFATLPKAVQDAYLNTYLPDVLKAYDAPRTPIPLARATEPGSVFDSKALAELQQFSDAVGGYFSPTGQPLQDTYNPQPPAPAAQANPNAKYADMAREWASVARPDRTWQTGQLKGRLYDLFGDDAAKWEELGRLVEEAGGIGSPALRVNDMWSAKYGQSFV